MTISSLKRIGIGAAALTLAGFALGLGLVFEFEKFLQGFGKNGTYAA